MIMHFSTSPTQLNHTTSVHSDCHIIMPIFNRREFLEQALHSLHQQEYRKWNLVIVDDGSTDSSFELLSELAIAFQQEIIYVHQENSGPGAARAKGQEFLAKQRFVAFFDSDDIWHPNYLSDMISLLVKNRDVDWIFCACERLETVSGKIIQTSTFNQEDDRTPLNFLSLSIERRTGLNIFRDNDDLAICQINEPINAGFQNSVLRSAVAIAVKIPVFRIGEDQAFLLAAILEGFKLAYTKSVKVTYSVHSANISNTNKLDTDLEKKAAVQREFCDALLSVKDRTNRPEIRRLIDRKVGKLNFWIIGYNFYWLNGETRKALKVMFCQIKKQPFNYKFWKAYFGFLMKAASFAVRSPSRRES